MNIHNIDISMLFMSMVDYILTSNKKVQDKEFLVKNPHPWEYGITILLLDTYIHLHKRINCYIHLQGKKLHALSVPRSSFPPGCRAVKQ